MESNVGSINLGREIFLTSGFFSLSAEILKPMKFQYAATRLSLFHKFHKWPRCSRASLHHGQVFESVTPLLLGLVTGPEELDLPLLGFNLVPVLFHLLLGGHVRVGHRLEDRKKALSSLTAKRVRSFALP